MKTTGSIALVRGLSVFAGLIVLLAVAFFARRSLAPHLEPAAAISWLQGAREKGWAIQGFALAYVTLTWLFVPATLFHMAAGATFGFERAILLNLIAFNLSSNLQFWVARNVGRATVSRWLSGLRLTGVERKLQSEGFRAALLIRVLPLPNLAVNVTAGLSAIRWRDFALGSFIGAMPVIGVYTWFASSLVQGVAGAKERALVHTLIGAALIIAFAVISRILARRQPDISTKP